MIFVRIQEFTPVFTVVIFPQNDNSGLDMKILKFLGIQPTYVTTIAKNEFRLSKKLSKIF